MEKMIIAGETRSRPQKSGPLRRDRGMEGYNPCKYYLNLRFPGVTLYQKESLRARLLSASHISWKILFPA